jgi:hypothetical protein
MVYSTAPQTEAKDNQASLFQVSVPHFPFSSCSNCKKYVLLVIVDWDYISVFEEDVEDQGLAFIEIW